MLRAIMTVMTAAVAMAAGQIELQGAGSMIKMDVGLASAFDLTAASLAGLLADVAALKAAQTAADAKIASLEAGKVAADAKIAALEGTVAGHTTSIAGQTTLINGHTTSINGHTSSITALQGVDTANAAALTARQGYAFHAFQGVQSPAAGACWVFDRVAHNKGKHYNPANGRFTAPITGVYYFYAFGLSAAADLGDTRWTIRKNDAAYSGTRFIITKPVAAYQTTYGFVTIDLNAGETASVWIDAASLPFHSDGFYTGFGGYLVA